jgi:hypothetical protein
MRLNKKAQSLMEYIVLILVILGVFIAMQNYIKRGFQGRWKSAVDDFGDQYDPRLVNSIVRHTINSSSNTTVITQPTVGGYFTNRVDSSEMNEYKRGYITVGDESQVNSERINFVQ